MAEIIEDDEDLRHALDDVPDVPNSQVIHGKKMRGGEPYELRPLTGRELLDMRKDAPTLRAEFVGVMSLALSTPVEELNSWLEEDIQNAGSMYLGTINIEDYTVVQINCAHCKVKNEVELSSGDFSVDDILDEEFEFYIGERYVTYRWPTVKEVSENDGDPFCTTNPRLITALDHYQLLLELGDTNQGVRILRALECVDCNEETPYVYRPQWTRLGAQYAEAFYSHMDMIGSWYRWPPSEILDMNDNERYFWAVKAKNHLGDERKSLSSVFGNK